MKVSKRRRAVSLRPIWTIIVEAKLDQSRVLVTNFRPNRSTLKGRSAGQRHTHRHTHRQTSRLVLRPDCAPSSERPHFVMPPSFRRCTPPRRRFNQNIPPSVVLLQQCHCRNRQRGKLRNLSSPSVLFESSRIFSNTQETQTQNMMDQNFEIRIL